ncbi:MAG: F0F1 ATP synthase subunit B [Desulfobacteraceae bacterium]|nr:F0F1 ATP synthase subunit B [Desulfobacteraceae bacterium]
MRLFEQGHQSREKYLKIIFFALVTFFCSTIVWASGGGGEHAAPAVSHWVKQDTAKVLNFFLLAIILFFVAKKPVKEFFTSRIKGIEEELTDLEQKKQEAEKKIAALEARLQDLDGESKKIIETYVQQGEEAKKRILTEAQEEATKLEEMAKRNIDMEFKTATAELKKEITEKAILEAEKLIQSSISSKDQDKLVDDYLEKVVA